MNNEHDHLLEVEIDRELKALPELRAPVGLVNRVMQTIQAPVCLPWYRQAWPAWPPALRLVSLAMLIAMVGGAGFAGWKITHLETVASGLHRVGDWFGSVGAMFGAVHVLVNTLGLLLKQLGTGFLIACLAIIAAGYALCLGLGTVSLRLAFARR
jgi:hypothetical protein